jgi:hypothetical protein
VDLARGHRTPARLKSLQDRLGRCFGSGPGSPVSPARIRPPITGSAHPGDAGIAPVGLALMAFGAAPAAAISPINLDTTFSQRIDGSTLNAAAGSAVHSAGLVNADNVPDTLVGDASGAGEADIVYGDAQASNQVVNLGSLAGHGYKMDSLNPFGSDYCLTSGWPGQRPIAPEPYPLVAPRDAVSHRSHTAARALLSRLSVDAAAHMLCSASISPQPIG